MNTNNDLRKKAFYLTVGTNILFFLLLMIIVAWKETYPPPEEYGIELGFENNELSDADSESFEENDEEVENQIVEDLEIEESMEPETIIEDAVEDNTTSNDSESSDLDEIQEIEITNDSESELSVDVSSENETNNKNESVDSSTINDRSPSSKIIDERAIFKNKSSSESGSKGSSLEMQGWVWDFEPNPIDNSRESGKIIFEIIVDYYGEIIGLKTLETTLSPAIEDIYREEILKLTFSPTNNDNPAEVSKGKITFIIKNN
tara:strand:- start:7516 stop:8298 length:783 start_codon:yes stop_codon:yes gene_type:complete